MGKSRTVSSKIPIALLPGEIELRFKVGRKNGNLVIKRHTVKKQQKQRAMDQKQRISKVHACL